jgi:hypothetical protein
MVQNVQPQPEADQPLAELLHAPFNRRARLRSKRFERLERFEQLERERSD